MNEFFTWFILLLNYGPCSLGPCTGAWVSIYAYVWYLISILITSIKCISDIIHMHIMKGDFLSESFWKFNMNVEASKSFYGKNNSTTVELKLYYQNDKSVLNKYCLQNIGIILQQN